MQGIWTRFRSIAKQNGFWSAIYDFIYVVWQRVCNGKVFITMVLLPDSISAASLQNPRNYAMRFVQHNELLAIIESNPELFSRRLVEEAHAKGDRCFGIFDDTRLISAGWYSLLPTRMDNYSNITFDGQYAYMFRGFTDPTYRGQNLHGLGMASAARAYAQDGIKGVVSYVEANNYASLKSCWRLGYQKFGTIYLARIFGKLITYHTAGCARYQMRVVKHAAKQAT